MVLLKTNESRQRYDEWKAWTVQHGLSWEEVGLDIEPDAPCKYRGFFVLPSFAALSRVSRPGLEPGT